MKTVLLIDGGYLRAATKGAGITYNNKFIEAFAKKAIAQDEYLLRVLYYDSPQFKGQVKKPVSGAPTTFSANDDWMDRLASLERFAVRKGTIGFRGWKLKDIPFAPSMTLTDGDFAPVFEQKGVDMRIGLDIASFSDRKLVDRIILVSGDTDMIPAMKHARKAGIEVALVQLPPPTEKLHSQVLAHADIARKVEMPETAQAAPQISN